MKKTLLSIICATALSVPAMADQIVVTFVNSEKYTGDCKNIVNFPEMAEGSVPAEVPVGDVCTFDLSKCNSKAVIKTASNPHLQIPKNAEFQVIPNKDITLTEINFHGPSANYMFPLSASVGTITPESDSENKGYYWKGEADSAVTFKFTDCTAGVRIMYIVIDYTKAGGSGVANIAVDENAPVKYYNLQGVEVVNPEAGSIVICRQGANVKKMVVK